MPSIGTNRIIDIAAPAPRPMARRNSIRRNDHRLADQINRPGHAQAVIGIENANALAGVD